MISVVPKFGTNYKSGQVFFTRRSRGIISRGITHFTKNELIGPPSHLTSHVGVCIGYRTGIEATLTGGVDYVDLTKYFNDNHAQIFFKEPILLDSIGSQTIIDLLEERIGDPYDPMLIVGHGLAFILYPWREKVMRRFNRSGSICSELAAWGLREGGYMDVGGYVPPGDYVWNPQSLFSAPFFKQWKDF